MYTIYIIYKCTTWLIKDGAALCVHMLYNIKVTQNDAHFIYYVQVRNMIVGRRGSAVCLSLRRLIHDPRSGDTLRCVWCVHLYLLLSICEYVYKYVFPMTIHIHAFIHDPQSGTTLRCVVVRVCICEYICMNIYLHTWVHALIHYPRWWHTQVCVVWVWICECTHEYVFTNIYPLNIHIYALLHDPRSGDTLRCVWCVTVSVSIHMWICISIHISYNYTCPCTHPRPASGDTFWWVWCVCLSWRRYKSFVRSIQACIYAYIHTYMHTYIHTYIHTYRQTNKHANLHTYINAYVYSCMHICIHTAPPSMHACMLHACMYAYIYGASSTSYNICRHRDLCLCLWVYMCLWCGNIQLLSKAVWLMTCDVWMIHVSYECGASTVSKHSDVLAVQRVAAYCSVVLRGAERCRAHAVYTKHDSLVRLTCFLPMCAMSQSRVWCQHRARAAARSHEPRPGTAGIC